MSSVDEPNTPFASFTELVIVCCHATYIGDGPNGCGDEDQWLLQDFQKSNAETGKPSESETFIAHIVAGSAMCEGHRNALLLVFSGGRTTRSERTEAESYAMAWINRGSLHYALEDLATDSFQNLLFSILKFHELTGRYPNHVTVITHAFKERRFLELHAPAIRWPPQRIRVHGINPPFSLDELEDTQQGEHQRGFKLFSEDPYGAHSPLADKRRERSWNVLDVARLTQDEAVQSLLRWTGGETRRDGFPGRLPWE